jgi:predicted outer membrane repeat protein
MKFKNLVTVCMMAFTTLLMTALAAHATDYYVATTGSDTNTGTQASPFLTIQRGVNACAATGDTVIVADGTYIGNGNRNITFGNRTLTVRSQNGPTRCIINPDRSGRAFYNEWFSTSVPTIDGFYIFEGGADDGGGIAVNSSSMTVQNCIFDNNITVDTEGVGGAISNNATLTVRNCVFKNNKADKGGGAIYNGGTSSMGGTLTIQNCQFSNNSTLEYSGGALDLRKAATVENCVFIKNTAPNGGGAIASNASQASHIVNCVFYRNKSGNGAAISSYFTGTVVSHCTFVNNFADGIGGIHAFGSFFVTNSIVYGTDITSSVTITYSCMIDRLPPGTGNIQADPQFVDLVADNFHLKSTSPCINAGTPTPVLTRSYDLDELPRTMGTAPDMGAYETPGTNFWFVDKTNGNDMTGNGTPSAPYSTVRKALTSATNGGHIYIKPASYGTDRPRITKQVQLHLWGLSGQSRIGKR